MFPGMIPLVVAAVGAFVAGIVVATYFERSRTAAERASFEKSSKTLLDQLTETRARLDQARGEDAAHEATIARLGRTPCGSIADGSVIIQTSAEFVPSTPSWFGEVVLMAAHLRKHGVLSKISEGVRFARRRFGRYEVIDFLVVLFGYAISGERTLEAFYERLQPFAVPFMALFERDQLPARSTLSRFLAALTEAPVEALRTLLLDDLLSLPLANENQTGGLVDRAGDAWVVFDIDGTREAARQRALPKTEALPAPQRRLNQMCAPGYTGRKRGEVVRRRTAVSQAHSYHWLGNLATEATDATERNCARLSPRSRAISRRASSHKRTRC